MKVLIAISCVLAVASAGLIGHHGLVLQAQHLPVIGPNGVPLEPAENVAARAHHAAAHAEAHARNGDVALLAAPGIAIGHAGLAVASPLAYGHGLTYAGPQHLPVIGPNGVPLEPAENVAARAHHAAAHAEAHARNGDVAILAAPGLAIEHAGIAVHSPIAYSGHLLAHHHLAVIGPNGVPLEPAENVAARAAHAASHIEAKLRNGDLALLARKRRGLIAEPLAYATHGLIAHQHLPVIGPNGVPLEPAANVVARAAHAAAHVEAHARNGDLAVIAAPGIAIGHTVASPLAYGHGLVYAGPQHLPVIGPNGVPLEPAANVAARAQHAASHIEAKVRNGDLGIVAHHPTAVLTGIPAATVAEVSHVGGLPLDTVEVVAARAAHLHAHHAIAHGLIL